MSALTLVVTALAGARQLVVDESVSGDCMGWEAPQIAVAQRECLAILGHLNHWQKVCVEAEIESRRDDTEPVADAIKKFGGAA